MKFYTVVIKPAAQIDISECFEWYELQQTGIGDKLVYHIDSCLSSIQNNPYQYQIRYKSIRMAKVSRFPISIHYTVEDDTIFVLGFFHNGLNPVIWSKRK